MTERRRQGAWIRYGTPIAEEELEVAAERYAVAVLQPWEEAAAARLKALSPTTTVLQYRCLSSVRSYEPGPRFSSGVSAAEAEQHDASRRPDDPDAWFARRRDGSRIEWAGYPGHWQMRHWAPSYRERWVTNVLRDLDGSAFDGVMADNDVYDDYYGLGLPLADGTDVAAVRASLDVFVPMAGERLAAVGRLLVPNVAESRRDPGRWARHGAYGGAFEECWLSWAPDVFLHPREQLAQLSQVAPDAGPGLVVARIATDGSSGPRAHPSFRYGLAAWWLAGGGRPGGFAATAHDGYSESPWIDELGWDLGAPLAPPRGRGPRRYRRFEHGWVGLNLGPRGGPSLTFRPPPGCVDAAGDPVRRVRLVPFEGAVLRRG